MDGRAVRDRLEQADVQERVEERYRSVIAAFERSTAVRVVRIDGAREPDAVFADVVAAVADTLPPA